MAIRKITEQEKKQMNLILRPKFGPGFQVTGGSCEENNGGTKYNLVVGDPVNTVSQENLEEIGKTLKEKWDSTAEYHSFGKKIS